jgi:hypothetical protein
VLYRQLNPSAVGHGVRGYLLPLWVMALGPDAVAHDARSLTPWRWALRLGHAKGPLLATLAVVGLGVMSLTPWATAVDVYFCKICDGSYIFLQNRDKINIKKIPCARFKAREYLGQASLVDRETHNEPQ